MSAETSIYETGALTTARGGSVVLQLRLIESAAAVEIRIDREERLPHKTLRSVVLKIQEPRQGIEALARAMTTIVHELERLLRQGYSLTERAAGGWRGAWHAELRSPAGARAAASWEIDLRKPTKRIEPLARTLASLDVPAPRIERVVGDASPLAATMREHGADRRRAHAVDALIAADPLLPAHDLLDELETRGLLAPTDGDTADQN
jgi:hypothetical protein